MKRAAWWSFIATGVVAVAAVAWLTPKGNVGVEIGDRLPEFSAVSLEGEEVSSADLEGEVVLLTVWATWCGPCRLEMPSIQAAYDRFGDDGLKIVAVSIDADPNYRVKVEEFRQEFGLTFPMLLDPANEITRTLNTIGVPENFVLDRRGRIVKRIVGASNWDSEANRAMFEELLRMSE